MVQEYEDRAKDLIADKDFAKVECDTCDVKDIQNTQSGVHGFWLKAILSHP